MYGVNKFETVEFFKAYVETNLAWGVLLQAGQSRLLAVALGPRLVSVVRLLDAAVVRDVLTLGVHAVQLSNTPLYINSLLMTQFHFIQGLWN